MTAGHGTGSEPSPERVAAASAAWIWVPDTARTLEVDDHLLVRYPDWFFHPLELVRFTPAGDVEAALDEALAQARTLDAAEITAWVKLDAPKGLDDLLLARGGRLDETLDVLALDLTGGAPDLPAPSVDVEVRWVSTPEEVRDFNQVGVEVFGGKHTPQEQLVRDAEKALEVRAAGEGGRVVGYVDGRPVATGGLSVIDGDARLWGGGVVEALRGSGLYRAMLAVRFAEAVAHGAGLAIVKGRVDTSAPIFRRAGFTAFGRERSYVVPL